MKRTEEVAVQQPQPSAIAKVDKDRRSKVIGLAEYKEALAVDNYRRALNTVVSNAQKADW